MTPMFDSSRESIKLPLDPTLYALDADELAFFQDQTGISDEQELKQHIVAVQEKAYETQDLPSATLPRSSRAAQEIPECSVPRHRLLLSTPETFPAAFIQGDAFDTTTISPREPFYALEEPAPLDLPLKSLTSLTPLQGRLNVIHASSFFHLFDEAEQLRLARQLATLLSPAPGSMIFGSHKGREEKGFRDAVRSRSMFCHSPETWKELWDGQVFKKGAIKAKAILHQIEREDAPGEKPFLISWAVTRL
ncbi:hypothetical protein C0989_009628 [Termitomyces sp. Mn162]|nr:hypothetical protein C0989_009628 [Termitomyces sp. Mn162]